jgi:tRNA G18 (ribose-2'-O)-methylase SpoU
MLELEMLGLSHHAGKETAVIITIDDPEDPRIIGFRDIRERDLVGRDRQFIAEGEVVLRVMLAGCRHRPLALLIADRRITTLAPLLAGVPADVPIYSAGQPILDQIAGYHLHRGILALGQQHPQPTVLDLLAGLGRQALLLVLIGIANHDNMGGILRNAAAFGADAILLDRACCDPYYRKAIRVSVGASLTLPIARFDSGTDCVGRLTEQGIECVALSPTGAMPLGQLTRTARMALFLGAEGPGLPDHILARTRTVAIRMDGKMDSLNVATTSGIVLHHLTAEELSSANS